MLKKTLSYTSTDMLAYNLCHSLGQFSTCEDKQVGAILFSPSAGILGSGFNLPVECNHKCDHSCNVQHAEDMAVSSIYCCMPEDTVSYVNLFPCLSCQTLLYNLGIKEVRVFGEQGNKELYPLFAKNKEQHIVMLPALPSLLLKMNGEKKQRQIVQGELAELITAISNIDSRDDRPESRMVLLSNLLDEIVDVELQLLVLKQSLSILPYSNSMMKKWSKLVAKFKDKFFPSKDL